MKGIQRLVSLVLALVMVVGMLPVSVLASITMDSTKVRIGNKSVETTNAVSEILMPRDIVTTETKDSFQTDTDCETEPVFEIQTLDEISSDQMPEQLDSTEASVGDLEDLSITFEVEYQNSLAFAVGDVSGTCGDNVYWHFDEATGVLTISGSGPMDNFYDNIYKIPWYRLYKEVITVVVEDGVTSIGNRAFSGHTNLKKITLPESVTSIGTAAFGACSNLEAISLPANLTYIGSSAFYGCENIIDIAIPSGTENILDNTFRGCFKLSNITIEEGVKTIGDSAFLGCAASELIIPDSVQSIGRNAFASMENLVHVVMPKEMTYIGIRAFSYCKSVISITIPHGVSVIEEETFASCSNLVHISLPDSLLSIGKRAFSGCYKLTGIKIPEGVTAIGENAFSGCKSITEIVVPDGVTIINDNLFKGCTGLRSVTLGKNVTSLGKYSFKGCHALTEIKIPESVTQILSECFDFCDSLYHIEFMGDAPQAAWTSIDDPFDVDAFLIVPADNNTWTKTIQENPKRKWVVRGNVVELDLIELPYQTLFLAEDELRIDGIKVVAVYDTGYVEELPETLLEATADMSTIGKKTATVAFGGKEVSFEIVVHGGTRIELLNEDYPESEHPYFDNTDETKK